MIQQLRRSKILFERQKAFIASRPNVLLEFCRRHMDLIKNYPLDDDYNCFLSYLSSNPNMPIEFFLDDFADEHDVICGLSRNQNLTLDHAAHIHANYKREETVKIEMMGPTRLITKTISRSLYVDDLLSNPNMPLRTDASAGALDIHDILKNLYDYDIADYWNFETLLPLLSEKELDCDEHYNMIFWQHDLAHVHLLRNRILDIDFLQKNINELWNAKFGLTDNPNITPEFIRKHNERWWLGCMLAEDNENITFEFATNMQGIRHLERDCLDTFDISQYCPASLDHVLQTPQHSWQWHSVIKNPGVALADVFARPDLFANHMREVSGHPDISLEYLEEHIDEIDLISLSENLFLWTPFTYRHEIRRDIDRKHDLMRHALDAPMPTIDSIARYIDWI